MERRGAHVCEFRQLLDAKRLVVVAADPADRPAEQREPTVCQTDLPNSRPLGTRDQSPQDLPLDTGGQRGCVNGRVRQRAQRSAGDTALTASPPGVASTPRGRRVAAGAVSSNSAAILSGWSLSTNARKGSSALACTMCPATGSSSDVMTNS